MSDGPGRYEQCRKVEYRSPAGLVVSYREPRVLDPAPAPAGRTTLDPGELDRLDLVAARTLGNPLLAWRIADANQAMSPLEVVSRPGATLHVPGTTL